MLLDSSNREIERRNMRLYNRARALNKLAHLFLDRLKKIAVPEQISYDTLNKFVQDNQKIFIVSDIDIKKWFPRISPFFIMDRRRFMTIHEKAKIALSQLNDFVTKEYVKTKTLEETFQLIDDVQSLENHLAAIKTQLDELEDERAPLEKEVAELEKKVRDLESKGPIDTLKVVDAEIEELSNEAKNWLRHLQKPFIKIQALSTHGGGSGLTPDELAKLGQYLDAPFEALATEQDGFPVLKEILEKLIRLLDEDKLKLKADKARKAQQAAIDVTKDDALAKLQARCKGLAARKQRILESDKLDENKRNLSAFQEEIDQFNVRIARTQSQEAVKRKEQAEIQERLQNQRSTIEKNIFSFLDKKVQIR
jgi:chromosome segregation ATPase